MLDKIRRLKGQDTIEELVLRSRYLLTPLIFALLYVILTITVDFYFVLTGTAQESRLAEHTLTALKLLDIMMIANLIWLISAGSFYVFLDNHYPDTSGKKRPRCLSHISTGILKEKLAGSLIGVSSIHLLQEFLNIAKAGVDWNKIGAQLAIHGIFIVGLLALNHANSADHHAHTKEEQALKEAKEGSHDEAH